MQTEINAKAISAANLPRIEVQTEKGRHQRVETVNLQPALIPKRDSSILNDFRLAESGVAFSPLND